MALIYCSECGSQVSDKAINCVKCGNPIKKINNHIENATDIKTDKNMFYWYLKVLKQYADFKGRARRKEYWMFCLFNMIFIFIAIILDNVLGIRMNGEIYGPLYVLYNLAVFIPSTAVGVRRLHDVGKSAWFILIVFIPLVGAIWLLVLLCSNSKDEINKWGENPKKIAE